MDDFHFLRPLWLLALIPAIVICWFHIRAGRRRDGWVDLVAPHLLPHLLDRAKQQQRWAPNMKLVGGAWLLAILALAGPTWQRAPAPFSQEESLAVIILDCGETMDKTDISPSRLKRAQFKISDLLATRGGDHALIAFSGSAHVVMPPTDDPEIIDSFSRELATNLMPTPGQDLLGALSLGQSLLEGSGQRGALVVVTDGVGQTLPNELPEVLTAPIHLWGMSNNAQETAKHLGASYTALSNDQTDVEGIVSLCRNQVSQPDDHTLGESWHDAGFPLTFAVASILVFWFRQGFVLPTGAN